MYRAILDRGVAVVILALCAVSAGRAQSPVDFYKGRNIDLYIGYSPAGGYDVYARALARHMGRFIPGNPTIVSKNMPGAGSLVLANWLYNVAPKDGTAFGMIGRGTGFDPLLGSTKAQFDADKFNWIGSMNDEVSVCVAWHTSGITKLEQVRQKEVTIGGTGPAADTDQFPKVLNATLGTRFKLVTGYPGGNEIDLAMERGEVMGRCGWLWSSVVATHQHWIDDKKINVLVQLSLSRHTDLAECPPDHGLRQDRRGEADLQAGLLASTDGPALPGTSRHSRRARDPAAQGVHGHLERPGVPRRSRKNEARGQSGCGRGGAGDCAGRLSNAEASRGGGSGNAPLIGANCRGSCHMTAAPTFRMIRPESAPCAIVA